jgi:hypothetical protein
MKNTKAEQLLWIVIATVFEMFMVFFIKDSGVVSTLAATFTGIIGVFIGLDIAVLIKKTSSLPGGCYKEINKHRYIAALMIFSALMIETFVISGVYGRNYDSLYASFGMGFLVVIGGLVAAVEGNKIVTGEPVAGETQEKGSPESTSNIQSITGNGNTVTGGNIK